MTRRLWLPALLALSASAQAQSTTLPTIFLTLKPETQTRATSDVLPSFTLTLENFGPTPRTFDLACPQVTVMSLGTRQPLPLPMTACLTPLGGTAKVTIAPDRWHSFSAALPVRLPPGDYEVTATIAGASGSLRLTVYEPPKLVQTLDAPREVRVGDPVTLTVTWHNPTTRPVGQDLRLCGLHYMVLGRGAERVADNLREMQVCLTDLRLTEIPPGGARQARWTLPVRLPPGTYTVFVSFVSGPASGSVSFQVTDPLAPL